MGTVCRAIKNLWSLDDEKLRLFKATFRSWPTAFAIDMLGRTRFAETVNRQFPDFVTRADMVGGGRMVYRPFTTDQRVLQEVWAERTYSPPCIVDRVRGGVLIDIGAHIGAFTVCAVVSGLASRVLAFEPFPSNFKLLAENVRINRLENALALPIAVSDEAGHATLIKHASNTGGHSFFLPTGTGITVPVTTLKDVFSAYDIRHCDLLKLDTEGSEYRILMGATPSILRGISAIALEYHLFALTTVQLKQLSCHLEETGFELIWGNFDGTTGMLYAVRDGTERR